jgi:integral membrane protein
MSQTEPPTAPTAEAPPIAPADVPAIRGALLRYRIMAYAVGVLLVVLVLVGMPLKYFADNGSVVTWTGVPHGWLYMLLIATAYDLGRRVRWPWKRLILIALAGTVPFLSFVAEHYARTDVLARLAATEAAPGSADELR